jgi:protein-L-isoaspartate(D-aspartate) O-methyltransferase
VLTLPSLEQIRRWYAEEIQAIQNIQDSALIEAFATVPRERFLGPGPWRIMNPIGPYNFPGELYRFTPDDDPQRLYHQVLIAVDHERGLNNGHPASLAGWFSRLALRPGERVVHIGCGTGYYSAILASVVGSSGRVIAIEVDDALAARARDYLSTMSNIEVVQGDGTAYDTGPFDAAFVNAGVTFLPRLWLDRMAPGARLIVPFTGDDLVEGVMVLVRRDSEVYAARVLSPVQIFPCTSARDAASTARLTESLKANRWNEIRQLRRDRHDAEPTCVFHGEESCLSAK